MIVKVFDTVALIGFCLVIYWLSDQSSLPMPMLFSFQDKIQHFTAYFIMSLLAWRMFRHVIKHPNWRNLVSIGFCSLYGITDEWHQSFVVGRSADILDWLADSIGASVAVFVLTKLILTQRWFLRK